MAKIICTLPNASASINGVQFNVHELGMVSEEVGQDVADTFLQITGYLDHDAALATSEAEEDNQSPADSATPTDATTRQTIALKKK
jgi:hypothetical protein